ncbi:MAG: 3'-5' exonuclease [Chloroherpetonaceae bacterium]|nr:3'-5' exonuclease [Chloroherpetonaceae bacterium]MCS7210693.1 3'-5' exonuclease [Chloroherpetonaceae bacterium]MDW8019218.1 3'-5' exonuclease [Chloroherpetonaceae bacterium]
MSWLRQLFAQKQATQALPDALLPYFTSPLPHKKLPIDTLTFVVIDTETTGLNPTKDQLLSIGAVRLRAMRVDLSETFFEKIYCEQAASPETIAVHFITPEESRCAPPLSQVLPQFLSFIGTNVLIAHHARFDLAFLNAALRKHYGRELRNYCLDTIDLAHALASTKQSFEYLGLNPRQMPEYELDKLAKSLNIPLEARHDALNDAVVTAQIAAVLLKRLAQVGVHTLQDLLYLSRI